MRAAHRRPYIAEEGGRAQRAPTRHCESERWTPCQAANDVPSWPGVVQARNSKFNPGGTWGPRGRGFSMGVVQHSGHVIHFTGQVAWNESEEIVGVGDVRIQV